MIVVKLKLNMEHYVYLAKDILGLSDRDVPIDESGLSTWINKTPVTDTLVETYAAIILKEHFKVKIPPRPYLEWRGLSSIILPDLQRKVGMVKTWERALRGVMEVSEIKASNSVDGPVSLYINKEDVLCTD